MQIFKPFDLEAIKARNDISKKIRENKLIDNKETKPYNELTSFEIKDFNYYIKQMDVRRTPLMNEILRNKVLISCYEDFVEKVIKQTW